jgi:hypothetical protein
MAKKKSGYSDPKTRKTVKKVMHEYKHGELKSGGRKTVKNPKQAIAIALSEARQAGAKVPKKSAGTKKKAVGKKATAKKGAATRKKSTKKAASKKAAAKKR